MAKITHLPNEVITIILKNESISIEDIIRFKSTCKRLQEIELGNCFWRKKFFQRCSIATKIYYTQKPEKTLDFKEQTKAGIKCIKRLQYYLSLMSDNNLSKTKKEELENILLSAVKSSMTYHFVSDEFNRIIIAQSWPLDFNLTITYNFELIFRFLKLYRFIYKFTKFLNKPYEKQLIERQGIIMAQYFQPHVSYSIINMWLDDIVQEVLSHLKIINSAHPIFTMSLEQFYFCKTNNISDNYWDQTESVQIMRILEKHIFAKDIDILSQLLIISDIGAEECISEELGNYLLFAIYQSVARRLGVRCIMMPMYITDFENFPRVPIKIVWKPKYNTEAWDNAEYFYIKEEDNLTYPSNISRGRYYNNTSPRLINNGRNLELTGWYPLTETHVINMLAYCLAENLNIYENDKLNLYYDLCSYLDDCTRDPQQTLNEDIKRNYYKKITERIQVKSDVAIEKQLKERTKEIKYAVGMIVTHYPQNLEDHYENLSNHDGVIIGWHHKCYKEYLKQLVIDKSQVHYECPDYNNEYYCEEFLASDQPHYIILTEFNKICYVKQGEISMCPPKEINNVEIGRFFYRFEGTHYVPNKNLQENYPNDTAAIFKILSSNYPNDTAVIFKILSQ